MGGRSGGRRPGQGQAALFSSDERNGQVDVLFSTFVERRAAGYEELFGGFDHLRAITFSYGLSFVSTIAGLFADAEIVLGSNVAVRPDVVDVAVHQQLDMRRISRHRRLVERVSDGTVRFWFNVRRMSHEKLYVMWADDGRCRVVVGSANLSRRAFTGAQHEEIVCYDGDRRVFEDRLRRFEAIQGESTSQPLEPGRLAAFVDAQGDPCAELEQTPVANASARVYLFDDSAEGGEDPDEKDGEVRYTYDPALLSEEERALLDAMCRERVSSVGVPGARVVDAKDVRRVFRSARAAKADYEVRAVAYPSFRYDATTGAALLNDRPYPLPAPDDWAQDARRVAGVMRGYDTFVGDTEETKRQLFKVMAFMFCAPFMARARRAAVRGNYSRWPFPNYCILYGDSNAGKSTFVRMCLRAMYGSRDTGIVPNEKWTKTGVREIDAMCRGMCVCFNDPDPDSFRRNMRGIIVDDEDVPSEHAEERPIYAVTVNRVTSLPPEFAKRSVLVRTEARIDREAGIGVEKSLNDSIDELTTALYLEYLARMAPAAEEMDERARAGALGEGPDLLQLSSLTLRALFEEAGEASAWNAPMSYGDFIGETATARVARDKLLESWRVDPEQFVARPHGSGVEYRPAGARDDRMVRLETKAICDELPAYLEATRVGGVIVFKNVPALEEFLGVRLDCSVSARARRLAAAVRELFSA